MADQQAIGAMLREMVHSGARIESGIFQFGTSGSAQSGERLSVKDVRNQISDTKAKADRAAVKQPKPDVRAAADRAEGLIAEQIKASPSTVGEVRNELMHPSAFRSRTETPVKAMTAEQAVHKLRDQIDAAVATAIGVSPMQPIIDTIFDIAAARAERNGNVKMFVQRVRQRIDTMDKVDQGLDAGCAPKIDLCPVSAAPRARQWQLSATDWTFRPIVAT
jgi:hypothetical protein